MFTHMVGCLSPPTDKEWGQSIMWGIYIYNKVTLWMFILIS
jgi:hypothetical protein